MFWRKDKTITLHEQVVFRSKVSTSPDEGRYLVLTQEGLCLYASKTVWASAPDKWTYNFPLHEISCAEDPKSSLCFLIRTPYYEITLKTKNLSRKDSWLQAINAVILENKHIQRRQERWKEEFKWTVHLHDQSKLSTHVEVLVEPDESELETRASVQFNKEMVNSLSTEPDLDDEDEEDQAVLRRTTSAPSRRRDSNPTVSAASSSSPISKGREFLFGDENQSEGDDPDVEKIIPTKEVKLFGKNSLLQPLIHKSDVIARSLNPVWSFYSSFPALTERDYIIVNAFDKKVGYLGTARIKIIEVIREGHPVLEDIACFGFEKWTSLRDESTGSIPGDDGLYPRTNGCILLKIVLVPGERVLNIRRITNQSILDKFIPVPDTNFDSSLRIFCGTWNMGNFPPPDSSVLKNWIPEDHKIDLYAIGFQESDFSTKKSKNASSEIENLIMECIGPNYSLVRSNALWGIRIYVLIAASLLPDVSQVRTTTVATGIANVFGNKGAVIVSLQIKHTTFCFVCCHLAAHQDKVKARNDDIREIIRNSISDIGTGKSELSAQFHHLFWFGDVNYRIDTGETDDTPSEQKFIETLTSVHNQEFELLFARDQLMKQMTYNLMLFNFSEMPLSFPPTFKMEVGTVDQYQTKRVPSWCDRILCKSLDSIPSLQLSYFSAREVCSSDHKPVGAVYDASCFHHESRFTCHYLAKDAFFTRLVLKENGIHSDISTGKLSATIRSELFDGTIIRSVDDMGMSLGYFDHSAFPLKVANFSRYRKTIVTFELKDGDSNAAKFFLGYGHIVFKDILEQISAGEVESKDDPSISAPKETTMKEDFCLESRTRSRSGSNPRRPSLSREELSRTRSPSAISAAARAGTRGVPSSVSVLDRKLIKSFDIAFQVEITSASVYVCTLEGTLRIRAVVL